MVDDEFVGEPRERSYESTFTEHEAGATPKGVVHPANSLEGITRLAETVRAINRPLFSPLLSEAIRAINRPLFSPPLSEAIRAINRPLFSPPLSEAIRAINRPLFSPPLSEAIRAINRPLFSPPLSEAIRAINRPLVNTCPLGPIDSFNPRIIPVLTSTPNLVTAEVEPQVRPDSLYVEDENCPVTGEVAYWLTQFDALITDDGLHRFCRSLFADGYYALAVQKAYIYIDNLVSKRSGRTDKDGADLMRTVFSPKNPVLKLNKLQSRSEENQQQGYMHMFEGVMIGIRNPRAHEYDVEDTPREALEMIVIANHLMRLLKSSTLA